MEIETRNFIEKAYKTIEPFEGMFTLAETVCVLSMYFDSYEYHTGRIHPFLKAEQLQRIIKQLDFCEGSFSGLPFESTDLTVDDYAKIIPAHFRTQYRFGCDFNVNHFMTGDIRFMRWLEECY